jgi:hypothetical protein
MRAIRGHGTPRLENSLSRARLVHHPGHAQHVVAWLSPRWIASRVLLHIIFIVIAIGAFLTEWPAVSRPRGAARRRRHTRASRSATHRGGWNSHDMIGNSRLRDETCVSVSFHGRPVQGPTARGRPELPMCRPLDRRKQGTASGARC